MYLRWLMSAAALVLVLGAPRDATAQAEPFSFKFNSGQGIQPIFEGWYRLPDGSIDMYFGYMNRNYVEELYLPVGPENQIQPTGPDRGQPTLFYPRIRREAFKVNVPKDWGKKELVWTVTVRGKTERAIGWMEATWEIDPIYDGRALSAEAKMNKAPAIASIDAPTTIALPNALTLNVTVNDDGLPKPVKEPPKRATGQETPPTLQPAKDQAEIPVNVPQIAATTGGGGGGFQRPQGLKMSWIVWRGPASATFEPATADVKEAKAAIRATFTKPGTYMLRGRATDGTLTDEKEFTITVTGQ